MCFVPYFGCTNQNIPFRRYLIKHLWSVCISKTHLLLTKIEIRIIETPTCTEKKKCIHYFFLSWVWSLKQIWYHIHVYHMFNVIALQVKHVNVINTSVSRNCTHVECRRCIRKRVFLEHISILVANSYLSIFNCW